MTTTDSTHQQFDLPHADLPALTIWEALRDCRLLTTKTPQSKALWLAIREHACTRAGLYVIPYGSTTEVEVTDEYVNVELIAAVEWLRANEVRARRLAPQDLIAVLRAVATRGANGSARAAQADLLHGMTHVPPGRPVRWLSLDEEGAA